MAPSRRERADRERLRELTAAAGELEAVLALCDLVVEAILVASGFHRVSREWVVRDG